jgi:hypothetical protein
VTAFIKENPAGWEYSSYNEYVKDIASDKKLCNFDNVLKIDKISYKDFVCDRIDYQRKLALIKEAALEG